MLSLNDRAALAAQWQQFVDEMAATPAPSVSQFNTATWDRFIAWRQAVALEEQAAALWSEEGEDEERPD